MAKTACYVDGFNLYHTMNSLEKPHIKWLNLQALAKSFLRPEDTLERVVYFTAHAVWDAGKLHRHKEYIAALRAVGVEPVISKFLDTQKHCRKHDRFCSFKEEKQTDVSIGVRIICECLKSDIERVILITADSDQVPTIAAIRALSPEITVLVAIPPGRKAIAKELSFIAHDSREISLGRLEQCMFPRNVRNAKGVIAAKCPAQYEHPEPSSSTPIAIKTA